MRRSLLTILCLIYATTVLQAEVPDSVAVHDLEIGLMPFIEVTDERVLHEELATYEQLAEGSTTEKLTLAIIYHESALHHPEMGYPDKGLAILNPLKNEIGPEDPHFPFVQSYRGALIVLQGEEEDSRKRIREGLDILDECVHHFGNLTFVPLNLRGRICLQLPKGFKRHHTAIHDFHKIIKHYESDPTFTSPRIASFAYYAWADLHKHHRIQRGHVITSLHRAVELDPDGMGGGPRAAYLLEKLEGHWGWKDSPR